MEIDENTYQICELIQGSKETYDFFNQKTEVSIKELQDRNEKIDMLFHKIIWNERNKNDFDRVSAFYSDYSRAYDKCLRGIEILIALSNNLLKQKTVSDSEMQMYRKVNTIAKLLEKQDFDELILRADDLIDRLVVIES